MEPISFIASLPDLQSSITMNPVDRSARIKLDIPGSDIAQVVSLLQISDMALKVTIEPIE